MAIGLSCRILVGKIDLDTVGAAFFLGVTREDEVEVLRGQATEADLANPEVICIEVGGSGQAQLNNWDHHGAEAQGLPLPSAVLQVFLRDYSNAIAEIAEQKGLPSCLPGAWCFHQCPHRCVWALEGGFFRIQLVDYINRLDTVGPTALGQKGKELFPTLSDIFAGMLLSERNPVEQLHLGVEILQEVIHRGIDSFGRMPIEDIPEWVVYAKAKAENNRQVAEAVELAHWAKTSAGLKLAYLETDFFGAPGALYGAGAQVVVAFSPHFGPAKVPKFTIAGNGVKVDPVLPKLNALEPGWGGPPTGTIIGSPREGSKLTLKEVTEIVKTTL